MGRLPIIFQKLIDQVGNATGRSPYTRSNKTKAKPPQRRKKGLVLKHKKIRRKMARKSRRINRKEAA